MDDRSLLAKSFTLLYRESQLINKTENSSDLVRTVLNDVVVNDIALGLNTEREIISSFKNTILEMCNNPVDHEYNKEELLQVIRVNTLNDDRYFEAIKQGIINDMDEGSLKRVILNYKKSINNHFKEKKLGAILHNASRTYNYERQKIPDINAFIDSVISELEPLQLNTTIKDPAIITELDLGDDKSASVVFNEMKARNTGQVGYITGWQDFNEMIQGRLRPGETVCINALQHKYKTGFTLSLYTQIAKYNIPRHINSGKKPLLLRISFEDDLVLNLQFIYQKLKYDETGVLVSSVEMAKLTTEEMLAYVRKELQVNGFHIKLLRIDPSQWTYKSIFNKIIELEAEGYAIEVLALDYLALIPTIGCITSGPIGSDLRDLFRRVRNFCAQRGILHITPHQLSTEAKALIRGNVPEDKFVTEIAEKGYYDKCRTLDQEIDLEIYIHLFKYNKETYFTVQRGKHRLPTIISEEQKYFIFKFPKNAPLPDDLNKEKITFRSLREAVNSNKADGTHAYNDQIF